MATEVAHAPAPPPALPHRYGPEIGEEDPRSQQPERIRLQLKPHQSAALAKAVSFERDAIHYDIPPPQNATIARQSYTSYHTPPRGEVSFKTNVAILGDAPSYGKTLIALSVIAQHPASEIHLDTYRSKTAWFPGQSAYAMLTTDRAYDIPDCGADNYFNTTLVVVPHGPVYVQWKNQIEKNTDLRVLAIDGKVTLDKHCPPPNSSHAVLKAFFEQYDIVLVKRTTLSKELMTRYEQGNPISAWSRIMVDEAHDIINTLPQSFHYKFLWLITATFESLPRMLYNARGHLTASLREIVIPAWFNVLTVRGAKDFVVKSFHIPPIIEHNYICELPRALAAVQNFLTPQVLDCINAGDISGAIQMLGGSANNEDGIVELVTRDIQRDIANKEREAQYLNAIDIPPIQRAARMQTINAELGRLRTRLTSLTERVTHLNEKSCDICGDPFENPVFLKCTHVTCAQCLIQWMQSTAGGRQNHKTCPTCRAPIEMQSLVAIVNQPVAPSTSAAAPPKPKTKEERIIELIRNKPEGRFLIFSRVDASLYNIMNRLHAEGIPSCELKGSTSQMMSKLRAFQDNEMRVILLNTRFAGSGIEITCATDVILVHSMGDDSTQAVGRANRVGRTTPLHVHKLLYPHEAQHH